MQNLLKALSDHDEINALCVWLDDRATMPATLEDAIRMQAKMKDLLEAATLVKSAFEKRHDWLRTAVVPPKMEERGITKIALAGIGRVHLQDDVFVSTEDKEKAFNWFDINGLGNMITKTINGSTLAAFIRQRIKSGEEMPEGVKITPYTKSVLTRS